LKKWRIKANRSKSIHVTFTTWRETAPPAPPGPYKQSATPSKMMMSSISSYTLLYL
jgi:hypothetical protein